MTRKERVLTYGVLPFVLGLPALLGLCLIGLAIHAVVREWSLTLLTLLTLVTAYAVGLTIVLRARRRDLPDEKKGV